MVHEGAQRNLIESNTCIDSKNAAGAGKSVLPCAFCAPRYSIQCRARNIACFNPTQKRHGSQSQNLQHRSLSFAILTRCIVYECLSGAVAQHIPRPTT